ncbi:4-hydroxybenzoate polyprenyltransferase [Devosia enhydra]|uniref:4-hydroxybenzoate octaprenyltransferase n=1 Tax=Devosia enhydra TaxID=665118 RepID=A0A1K2I176_9HYPH|nr:4-hydroxybenzoate octaprenyltransferase [Devosia enhydra]SFZ86133.1 4-hydroxybenzoate polyprenyltransferase [Devosia enhydra]
MQSPTPNATGGLPPGTVADAQRGNWVDRFAPDWLKPYARLARWDRPIGFWLLFWPCGFGLGLAAIANPQRGFDVVALVLCLVGAIMMRGAGCTFNDIVDRDFDARVARTRSRPIPSGQVTPWHALLFMLAQSLAGFLILIQFNMFTIWLGIASLGLVAIYPFMKRITWWPQLYLGFAFSWGALVGWASQDAGLTLPAVLAYIGSILWVIGYDTIYALQDVEDDALAGVKSTARLFGANATPAVAGFYAGAVLLWAIAAFMVGAGLPFVLGMGAVVAILVWQVVTLVPSDGTNALVRFKANHWAGLALTLALVLDWLI